MRTTSTALALTVLLLSAAPGHATSSVRKRVKTPSCAITDPKDDVTLNGSSIRVSDDHIDLLGLDVATGTRTMAFQIRNVTADSAEKGIWRVTFRINRTPVFVTAGTGVWLNVGEGDTTSGFYAGIVGKRPTAVVGHFVGNAIQVNVPATAFGVATLRRGTVLSAFAVESKETLVTAGALGSRPAELAYHDTMTSRVSYVVGRTCRP